MRIGNKNFDIKNEVYIMGILNITPDSFSDGGKFYNPEKAVAKAAVMEEEGAAIIDIGGESTRPGHLEVSEEEEYNRVIPVIRELKNRISVPMSIDTSKASVAEAALEAGASMINDVWGFKKDKDIAKVAADKKAVCCLMHNRKTKEYRDIMREIKEELLESVQIALDAGVESKNIILDPGIGFGKTLEDNLEVMNRLEELNELRFPWLIGTSRKSMIGLVLDLPVHERVEGTIVTTVLSVLKGASFIRVHDVKENLRSVKMLKAILKACNNE